MALDHDFDFPVYDNNPEPDLTPWLMLLAIVALLYCLLP